MEGFFQSFSVEGKPGLQAATGKNSAGPRQVLRQDRACREAARGPSARWVYSHHVVKRLRQRSRTSTRKPWRDFEEEADLVARERNARRRDFLSVLRISDSRMGE